MPGDDSLAQAFERAALTRRGVTFVNGRREERFRGYGELYDDSLRVLGALQRAGLRRGAEIVLLLREPLDFLRVFWAAVLGGMVPVPLAYTPSSHGDAKLRRVWGTLDSPHLVATRAQLASFAARSEAPDSDCERRGSGERSLAVEDLTGIEPGEICASGGEATALIQFSSGSTGEPKGIVLSHRNVLTNIHAIRKRCCLEEVGQLVANWMPLTHDMGLIGFHLTPVVSEWDHILMRPELFLRDPVLWLEVVSTHRATITGSPNFGLVHTLRQFEAGKSRPLELGGLKYLLNGAEPVSAEVCREFLKVFGSYGLKESAMVPVYGLAEASLAVTFPRAGESWRSISLDRRFTGEGDRIVELASGDGLGITFVDVGPPVDSCELRIVGGDGKPLPEEVIGRVEVRGGNVTRCYLSRQSLLPAWSSGGWLDTGDLGFLRAGRLVITGRRKELILVHGQNFYPQDVESVVARAADLDESQVAVVGFGAGEMQVAAFLRHRGPLEEARPLVAAVKRQVGEQLGLAIRHVVPVRRIPRTTSGKVRRGELVRALEAGRFRRTLQGLEKVPVNPEPRPRTDKVGEEVVELVVAVWRRLLAAPDLDASSHFFEHGGDSLTAARAVTMVGRQLGLTIPVSRIFLHPVAFDFAAGLATCERATEEDETVDRPGNYPLTASQRPLVVIQKVTSETTAYNLPVAVRVEGPLSHRRLEDAFRSLVQRHAALRTEFPTIDGEPVQRIRETVEASLPVQATTRERLEEELTAWVAPFDLERAPLLRAQLFRLSATENVLALDAHHAVLDGASMVRLVAELAELYDHREVVGSVHSFPWAGPVASKSSLATAERYWRVLFADGLPTLDLPTDFPRPVVNTFAGDRVLFVLDADEGQVLRRLAAAEGATLFAVLLSAFYVLLSRLCAQRDIVVLGPFSGRQGEAARRAIGMFVRSFPLRQTVEGRLSDVLGGVARSVAATFDHGHWGVEEFLAGLGEKRRGRNPPVDVMFAFQSIETPPITIEGVQLERLEIPNRTAKFDLCLKIWEEEGCCLNGALEYATDLFCRETVERFVGYYRRLLTATHADVGADVSDWELLGEEERRQILYEYNDTDAAYPENCTVHALFETQARRTPSAPAILAADTGASLTYDELNVAADRLASRLRALGARTGEVVAILLARSPEMVVAVLAVLKAGAAYLPLEPDFPPERLASHLEDAGAMAVIARRGRGDSPGRFPIPVVDPDGRSETGDGSPAGGATAEDLAYILFTSGTTASPKGVMVEHRALVNYTTWAVKRYLVGERPSIALHTSLMYDLTVTSIFPPLVCGGTIFVYPPGNALTTLRRVLGDGRIDVVKLTPSHLKPALEEGFPIRVRCLIVGGESFETDLARRLADHSPGIEIYNEYGPTEATVACMAHRFDSDGDVGSAVPIGTPVDNCRIYVLDARRRPVPPIVLGEIFIAGACLARGYLGGADRTRRRFLANPFLPGTRMYRTGDWARRLPDGALTFAARHDEQLKIRGHRVSPAEVASNLRELSGVRDAVVLAEESAGGDCRLVAYLVVDRKPVVADIRRFLSRRIPAFLIPAVYHTVTALPLAPHGKLDRRALVRLARPLDPAIGYEPPGDEVERALCELWREILNVRRVGRNDNFLDLGGDSIKALTIASRGESRGLKLSVRDVLEAENLADLARQCQTSGTAAEPSEPEWREKPLTPMEAWFFEQGFERPQSFCQAVLLRFHGRACASALHKALTAIVEHHDGLRLKWDVGGLCRSFLGERHSAESSPLMVVDLGACGAAAFDAILQRVYRVVREGFDLACGQLFRAILLRTGGDDFLLLVAHHLVVDGVSWRILLEDLHTGYEAATARRELRLPSRTASVAAFARALLAYGATHRVQSQREFWRQMRGPSTMASGTPNGQARNLYRSALSVGETEQLGRVAQSIYNTDPGTLMIVALLRVLRRRFGTSQHTIELEHHGRNLEGIDLLRTVGWLTSLYPLALRLPEATVNEQIKSVKEQLVSVPDSGRAYGVLRYLENDSELRVSAPTAVRFNYLGDFGGEAVDGPFTFVREIVDLADEGPRAGSCPVYQIDALLRSRRLQILVRGERPVEEFAKPWLNEVREVTACALEQSGIQPTPSDFDALVLGQHELDEMLA